MMPKLEWMDCPVLGDGWKRKEVVRRSGTSSGKTDVYYMSPTKRLIRSKVKLGEFLGDRIDLSVFDFKKGVLIPHDQKKIVQRHSLPYEPPEIKPKKPRLSAPVKQSVEPQHGSELVQCQGCKIWTTEYVKTKQSAPYCTKCQASRCSQKKARGLKNGVCGTCAACKLTVNCGYCTMCLLRSHNSDFGDSWKCVRRRCLKVIHKHDGCGICEGCCTMKDCNDCPVCLAKKTSLVQNTKATCLKRLCSRKPIIIQPLESASCGAKKFVIKNEIVNMEKPSQTAKVPIKQEHDDPGFHKPFKPPEPQAMSSQPAEVEVQVSEDDETPVIKQEQHNGEYGAMDEIKSGNVRVVVIKEVMLGEMVSYERNEEPQPLNLRTRSVTPENVITEEESTPVIKDVFSLVSQDAVAALDPSLQRLMEKLNEIPLPAYWEVQENTAPNLQLIQRDKRSPMWNSVIYIQPSFQFFVTVKDQPVPSNHKLYDALPRHLTTVYDVVELICSLESYRPCTGLCAQGQRSISCRVLVEEGLCAECSQMPWLSESKP